MASATATSPLVPLTERIETKYFEIASIRSGSYTQKGVLKIQLRADKLTIVGQKELIEAFDNGQETLFLL